MQRKGQFYLISLVLLGLSYYLFFHYLYNSFSTFTLSILPDYYLIENYEFMKVYNDWLNIYFNPSEYRIEVNVFPANFGDYVFNLTISKVYFNFSCTRILVANSKDILPVRIYHLEIRDGKAYNLVNGTVENYNLICRTKCFIYVENTEKILGPLGNYSFYFASILKPLSNGTIIKIGNLDLSFTDKKYILNVSGNLYELDSSGAWDYIVLLFNYNQSKLEFYVNFKQIEIPVLDKSFLSNQVTLLNLTSELEFLVLSKFSGNLTFSRYIPLPFKCSEDQNNLYLQVFYPFEGKPGKFYIYGNVSLEHPILERNLTIIDVFYVINYNLPSLRKNLDYKFENGTFYFNITNPMMEVQLKRNFIIS